MSASEHRQEVSGVKWLRALTQAGLTEKGGVSGLVNVRMSQKGLLLTVSLSLFCRKGSRMSLPTLQFVSLGSFSCSILEIGYVVLESPSGVLWERAGWRQGVRRFHPVLCHRCSPLCSVQG